MLQWLFTRWFPCSSDRLHSSLSYLLSKIIWFLSAANHLSSHYFAHSALQTAPNLKLPLLFSGLQRCHFAGRPSQHQLPWLSSPNWRLFGDLTWTVRVAAGEAATRGEEICQGWRDGSWRRVRQCWLTDPVWASCLQFADSNNSNSSLMASKSSLVDPLLEQFGHSCFQLGGWAW